MYPEVCISSRITGKSVIANLRTMFARHGMPEEVFSESQPLFSSSGLRQFVEDFGIVHQALIIPNQMALWNRTQTIRNLLKKSFDRGRFSGSVINVIGSY